ncbi:hypothetical protein [Nocardia aurea]|jgi:hypothetical protein|uniref:hypothetical protein n=1 Tax=Nocardia aurea TaxID=2144174 RepID=UPI0033A21501
MSRIHPIDAAGRLTQILASHEVIRLAAVGKFSCRACPSQQWSDYKDFAEHQAQQVIDRFDLHNRTEEAQS